MNGFFYTTIEIRSGRVNDCEGFRRRVKFTRGTYLYMLCYSCRGGIMFIHPDIHMSLRLTDVRYTSITLASEFINYIGSQDEWRFAFQREIIADLISIENNLDINTKILLVNLSDFLSKDDRRLTNKGDGDNSFNGVWLWGASGILLKFST